MPDDIPGAAQSLYPDLPSALDPPAIKPETPTSDAARSLYGDGRGIARPADGKSPLGGQARPSTLLGSDPQKTPSAADTKPETAEPFDPSKVQAPDGLNYDTALMSEYSAAVKDLGLDHEGATRLLDLHAKTQKAEAAQWEQTSAQWLNEVQARIPPAHIEAARDLVLDSTLTDPELAKWLGSSPAGNWMPLVRTLANYANALAAARRRY